MNHYRWEADGKIEIHHERPSKRFVVMTLGGYWPRLLKLRDGRLMVVAREGDLHLGQRGRIVGCFSPDEGESWSHTRVITAQIHHLKKCKTSLEPAVKAGYDDL